MEIPLARPDLTEADIQAVVEVLRTPQLSLGPRVEEFERRFTDLCATRHAVAVSSGTSALHLCVRALGIGPGDEVVTTPFSFVASSNCILFEGGTPVFADIDPETWNIDPAKVEAAITPRTKALLPVDVFGQVADMDALLSIARKHGLRVIEDSCEALGATFGGKPAGSFGDAGVFGFYPNKQITTGEGGMIVTDDERIAALCRSMRNQGRDPDAGWLAHARLGYNFRLADINCALGIAQMRRLGDILAARRRVAEWYRQRLGGDGRVRFQKVHAKAAVSWFVLVVRLADEYTQTDRDAIMKCLQQRGVACGNYFSPIHLQPFYVQRFGYRPGAFPVTEALSARTIALPFFARMSASQVDFVCTQLLNLIEHTR